ncbi:MAG TPA: hypothetical protein VKZ49_07900 [Polyangiaceae bacterium]|nr:hypothetical protein [Polyangiaceae bacterium]
MSESNLSKTMADRAAIERWEGEGGRPLIQDIVHGARSGAGASLGGENGTPFDPDAAPPARAERSVRPSSS